MTTGQQSRSGHQQEDMCRTFNHHLESASDLLRPHVSADVLLQQGVLEDGGG